MEEYAYLRRYDIEDSCSFHSIHSTPERKGGKNIQVYRPNMSNPAESLLQAAHPRREVLFLVSRGEESVDLHLYVVPLFGETEGKARLLLSIPVPWKGYALDFHYSFQEGRLCFFRSMRRPSGYFLVFQPLPFCPEEKESPTYLHLGSKKEIIAKTKVCKNEDLFRFDSERVFLLQQYKIGFFFQVWEWGRGGNRESKQETIKEREEKAIKIHRAKKILSVFENWPLVFLQFAHKFDELGDTLRQSLKIFPNGWFSAEFSFTRPRPRSIAIQLPSEPVYLDCSNISYYISPDLSLHTNGFFSYRLPSSADCYNGEFTPLELRNMDFVDTEGILNTDDADLTPVLVRKKRELNLIRMEDLPSTNRYFFQRMN